MTPPITHPPTTNFYIGCEKSYLCALGGVEGWREGTMGVCKSAATFGQTAEGRGRRAANEWLRLSSVGASQHLCEC